MSRDNQFAGFAKMLWQELCDEIDWRMESGEGVEQIIARRAYDLIESACADISMADRRLTLSEMIACVTGDLSTFPETGK